MRANEIELYLIKLLNIVDIPYNIVNQYLISFEITI